MNKQEKIHKYMKWLKGYIIKEFKLVDEWEDQDGYIGYLFIMEENFYSIYQEKDEVYIQPLGPTDKNYYTKLNWFHLLLEEQYKWYKKEK